MCTIAREKNMGTRCVILIGPAAHEIARHRNSRQHGTLLGEQNSGLSSWLYGGLKVIDCHTHQGIAQLVSIRVLIVQVVGSNPKCSFLKVLTPIYRWVHLLVSIIVVTDWWTSTWHVICHVRGERELCYPQNLQIAMNESQYSISRTGRCLPRGGPSQHSRLVL
jgi:hypothetical protein